MSRPAGGGVGEAACHQFGVVEVPGNHQAPMTRGSELAKQAYPLRGERRPRTAG